MLSLFNTCSSSGLAKSKRFPCFHQFVFLCSLVICLKFDNSNKYFLEKLAFPEII
jgi:hypothetical protein